jgi:peptide/nickel transport system substrate-binding protein
MTADLIEHRVTRRRLLQGAVASGVAAAAMQPCYSLAKGGKRLRVRSATDIMNLDPGFHTVLADAQVMACIFVYLATYKTNTGQWGWESQAARSLQQLDQTHISFELHPGILFSNGYGEMTAEDVKFSIERIADPAVKSPYAEDWAALDHVELKDRYSGTIVLTKPFAPLWTVTLPGESSCVISRKAMAATGGRFSARPPCTSGPYRIKRWEPKTQLLLERNPDWKLSRPAFDEIEILPIDNEKSAEYGFRAGDLDFTKTSVSSIPRFLKSPPVEAKFMRLPSLDYVWLGINQDNEQFKDIRVRKAVQYAVDREAIVDAAYLGAAQTATGVIAPGLPGCRKTNRTHRDVEKSKALLREAGLERGFTCTLTTLNLAERLAAAQVIQANLAEVGIAVQINRHDSGTFWSLGAESAGDAWRSLQLILNRFTMRPDPSFATRWFTPAQIGTWNWERFDSKEYAELSEKALTQLDPAKRADMYVRMQDLMEESGDYVFLTHEAVGVLWSDEIVPALRPDGTPFLPGFRRA